MTNAEDETLVGVIIESQLGVSRACDIAATEGVDIVFFGPGDLSHELGVIAEGWDSPAVQEAWEQVRAATAQANKLLMGISLADSSETRARELFGAGADLVCVYMDLLLIQSHLSNLISDEAQVVVTSHDQ